MRTGRPIVPREVIIPPGPSIAYVQLTRGLLAIIDREDAARVGAWNWQAHQLRGQFYPRRAFNLGSVANPARSSIQLSRYIRDATIGKFIVNVNGNYLDCRKSNLAEVKHNWALRPKKPDRILAPPRSARKVFIPIGPSIAYVPLTQGYFALIDREDAEWVGKHNWGSMKAHGDLVYAARRLHLHSAILGTEAGKVCDHVNGNALDNRQANLRFATFSQNGANRRGSSKSITGLKGVSFNKKDGRYRARIDMDGRYVSLGSFRTKEEAHAAYCKAAKKHQGEFARLK